MSPHLFMSRVAGGL